MRLRHLALPALTALALAGGLAVGTLAPSPGVGTPTPSPAHSLEEDDPGWDCAKDGNRICGPVTDADKAAGWAVWDDSRGYRSLKIDPSRPYRVEYAGISANPKLGENQAAVIGKDFQWHVFTVVYTD